MDTDEFMTVDNPKEYKFFELMDAPDVETLRQMCFESNKNVVDMEKAWHTYRTMKAQRAKAREDYYARIPVVTAHNEERWRKRALGQQKSDLEKVA